VSSRWTDDAIDRAVEQSVAEHRLHPGFRSFVRRFLLSADTEWQICCDGGCDPCVRDLIPAVERARALLGGAPPGS
jgi:hypothetical protein